jgi:uncharacterized Zn ribbon protein
VTSQRPLPPPLVPRAPDCSICGQETEFQDGWECPHCGAYWSDDNRAYEEPGEWYDESLPRCESIHRPYEKYANSELDNLRELRWVQYRCILELGHKDGSKHIHPECVLGWTSKQEAEPDERAIPDPHGKEYFPIVKERRRGFETKPISLAWPFDDEEAPYKGTPASEVDVVYRSRVALETTSVTDVHLPD